MQVHRTLPKNEGFFSRYATLIPTLFKVGFLSQLFSAVIETYILFAILRPKFDGLADHPGACALAASLFLVLLLEVGLRGTATFAARAVLYRRFQGLDLVMTVFIFLLTASLLVCSIALHIGGAKEAVESGDKGPDIEQAGHVDTAYQREAAGILAVYASDSAALVTSYANQITTAKDATRARARVAGAAKKGAAVKADQVRADGAGKVADLETLRGSALASLVATKTNALQAAAAKRDQAASKIETRNDGSRGKAEARTAKYSGWLSTFSVLTVVFFLLTIALNEVYLKGSGIEQVAIGHQYFFDEGLLAKFGNAVSNKFQYHARAGIEVIENSTPAPRQPLQPHPLFDYVGLTPARVQLAAALRSTASRNLNTGSPSASLNVPEPAPDWSDRRCLNCGQDFTPAEHGQLTCSQKCYAAHYSSSLPHAHARDNGPMLGVKVCAKPGCEKEFSLRALNQKYCSEACKLDDHEARHGRRFEPAKARFNPARKRRPTTRS